MDSQVSIDGYLLSLVDDSWRSDKLPTEEIIIQAKELPDPEADNADANVPIKEQENKWTDLAYSLLRDQH